MEKFRNKVVATDYVEANYVSLRAIRKIGRKMEERKNTSNDLDYMYYKGMSDLCLILLGVTEY